MNSPIGEIIKSKTNKVAININEFNGKKTIDIRDWFKKDNMQDWQPTQRGVSLSCEEASNLVSIFERLEYELTKGGASESKQN